MRVALSVARIERSFLYKLQSESGEKSSRLRASVTGVKEDCDSCGGLANATLVHDERVPQRDAAGPPSGK